MQNKTFLLLMFTSPRSSSSALARAHATQVKREKEEEKEGKKGEKGVA